jgi:hypothetical protein
VGGLSGFERRGGARLNAARPNNARNEIVALLTDRVEELAEQLLGPPNKDTLRRSEWRWGAKGSAALVVRDGRGKRRGAFYSHEATEGGSPLDLICHANACSIAEAFRFARAWLGLDNADPGSFGPSAEAQLERNRRKAEQDRQAEEHARQRADLARRIWSEAVSVAGTPAGRYLTNTRCIPEPAEGWPWPVRFHAASRSLVVAATADDGTVKAIQQVYLTPEGRKIGPAEQEQRRLPAVKQTTAQADGAAVRLPGASTGPLLLCEGPETGLSLWRATGHEVWIALGKVAKLTPPAGRVLVVCRDDDRKKKPGTPGRSNDEQHRDMIAAWKEAGLEPLTVLPWPDRRNDGSDFNDVLIAFGLDAVRHRIELAVPPDLPPEYPLPTMPLREAREALKAPVAGFFREALEWGERAQAVRRQQKRAKRELKEFDRERHGRELTLAEMQERADIARVANTGPQGARHDGLKVGLGIGKTHAVAKAIGAYVEEAKRREIPSTVLWTCPTLDLADQTGNLLREAGLKVGVYRGRNAKDPDAVPVPSDENAGRMCLDLPAVAAALDAGESVSALRGLRLPAERAGSPEGRRGDGGAQRPLSPAAAAGREDRQPDGSGRGILAAGPHYWRAHNVLAGGGRADRPGAGGRTGERVRDIPPPGDHDRSAAGPRKHAGPLADHRLWRAERTCLLGGGKGALAAQGRGGDVPRDALGAAP